TVSRPPVESRTQTPRSGESARTSTSSRPPDLAKGSTPSQPLPDPPHRTPSSSTPPRSVSSELPRAGSEPPVRPPTEPPAEPPARAPTEPPAAGDDMETEDDDRPRRPESKRYDALTHPEKIQLALHGSRDDRAQILRDKNRTLHPFVLKNPQ